MMEFGRWWAKSGLVANFLRISQDTSRGNLTVYAPQTLTLNPEPQRGAELLRRSGCRRADVALVLGHELVFAVALWCSPSFFGIVVPLF